ncbi:MAG: TIGR04100 family radical SAM protein [Acutalibacteraceae bacterium]|jgi:radical SAM enzyme (TIGR04100 family)|nr:TIGR04100 family radical SAM protein [Acutalibacteraceae bacterium]
MNKSMTIFYEVGNNIYVNITNRCPDSCEWCIRKETDEMDGENSLWLSHEPSLEEIEEAFDKLDLSKYGSIVFCGFGEPTERLDVLLESAKYMKSKCDLPIRINTNGLSDLIWGRPTAELLEGIIDEVSISLNYPTEEEYTRICHPKFGPEAYEAMKKFAVDCKEYVPKVIMTVVEVIGPEKVEACRKICEELGVNYRVRAYIE